MQVRIGFHVSIAGGISNSVDKAKELGCTAFQIFSRNPRGWSAKPLQQDEIVSFKNKLCTSGIERTSIVVHMPYLPNLSGPPGELYEKSVKTLIEEMERSYLLGVSYLVIHLGSHMGQGSSRGIDQLVDGLLTARASNNTSNGVIVLLENNVGQKNSIGAKLEELRLILDRLDNSKQFGVCIDTCHLFAAGYDLRRTEDVNTTFDKIEDIVGLKELRIIHLNDSRGELGSNLDRHEHIGLGSIGLEGIRAFLNHQKVQTLPIIMETPFDKRRGDEQNLRVVLDLFEK